MLYAPIFNELVVYENSKYSVIFIVDLMLPGVIVQYGGFDGVKKGQVMAIRVMGNRYVLSSVSIEISKNLY